MRLKNFSVDSAVGLGFGGQEGYLDLHNCFDWQGFEYDSQNRVLRMRWVRTIGDWVQAGLPAGLRLEFRDVSKISTVPRDPKMPYSEDSCLAHMTFLPPELGADFEKEFPGYRHDDEHLMFHFMSGFGLKIWAAEAELVLAEAGKEKC